MDPKVKDILYPEMNDKEIAERRRRYYAERISTQPDKNFFIRQPVGFFVVDSEGKILEGEGVCIEG